VKDGFDAEGTPVLMPGRTNDPGGYVMELHSPADRTGHQRDGRAVSPESRAVASRTMSSSSTPDAPYRLPRTVEPTVYRLCLAPDLDAGTFTGSAEIDIRVVAPVDRIICNAAELSIERAEVDLGGGIVHTASIALDEKDERVTFTVPQVLEPGRYVLRCRFAGSLNDKLRGFYRSTFVDQDGITRTIATTQLEATDARRAFPCWDEPDRKASFEVTLLIDPSLAAFSNSPIVKVDHEEDGRLRVRFAPTMPMSTYLVALIVGPLEATEPVDVDGVPVRVVHVPGKGHLTSYALEVAAHALRFFSSYFDIPYPAEKLDLVAIPDFAFGAMENLGCVTFRETALLIDPASAARTELERVADVVSHEIAHMWFGDLVTMQWWEGIWLNEAFATFMEVLCVDAFRPAWERWVSFGLEREAALAVDGLRSTRPIEYPVGSPEEAEGMFDVLTYQKGGSVLRMLEQYIGPDAFRRGVRAYLVAHAHGNTVTSDLWDALEDASGEPVRALMDSWILQGGHPLVSLRPGRLVQEPFSYDASARGSEPGQEPPRWNVPVLMRRLDQRDAVSTERLLLTAESIEDPVLAPSDGPLVVNAGGWGVYRVAYETSDLERLAGHLDRLDALERSNLVADTWALVLSGRRPLEDFFSLARHLGHDSEPSTFSTVAGALGLCDRVVGEGDRPILAAATRSLLGPRARELGWDPSENEGERIPTLRALLIGALGTIGEDEAIRADARRRFDEANRKEGPVPINPDIEAAVLEVVAASALTADYEKMLARYRAAATPQEELRYLTALAKFPDVELGARTFDLALEEVRTQNAPYLILALLTNRVVGPVTWQRITENWSAIIERFPDNSHARMLDGVRALCGDAALAEKVTSFLREHPIRAGQRTVEQSLERLAVNVAFGERERGRLREVLERVIVP